MTMPDRYHARLQRVLDHIDRHLDENLSLASLSSVAAFSPSHFQRQFAAVVGISAHRYVQLARLKRASYRLAYRDAESITGIALDAGYDAPEGFARVFRQRFGQSPLAFRQAADWESWLAALGPLTLARTTIMAHEFHIDEVTIIDRVPIPVAVMQHRGDPALIGDTIQRFIAWRRGAGLPPRLSATFNVFHSDADAEPADFRLDLCAATGRTNFDGDVIAGVIPGGRCAVLRMTGSSDDLEAGFAFLYRDWLPGSGAELRDVPPFCQRVTFFPDVPAHEAVTDLFLPMR